MNFRPALERMPLVPAGGVRAGSWAAGAEAPPPRGSPRSPSRAAAFELQLAAAGRTAGLLLAARERNTVPKRRGIVWDAPGEFHRLSSQVQRRPGSFQNRCVSPKHPDVDQTQAGGLPCGCTGGRLILGSQRKLC